MNAPSVLLALSLSIATTLAAEPSSGFTPLFNGRDLSGWVNVNCAPETFTVRDGMIHCDGIPTGALRTERQYENFILELEWRHMKSGGNAGVFIWSGSLPAPGQPFLRAIEVQVLDHGYGKSDWFTTHGDIFPIHGSTMKPFSPSKGDRSFPKEFRSKGTNEWNHYRIVATNGVIRLSVNGAEVSGGTDCSWRKGYIALESEGGIVDWRNLRIQELPSSNPAADRTAPAAVPWESLYDGRSLRGWTGSPEALEVWKPSDWNLRCAPTAPTNAILWSTAPAATTELFVDWRVSGKPTDTHPPIVFQSPDSTIHSIPSIGTAMKEGWHRLTFSSAASGWTLRINQGSPVPVPLPDLPLRLGFVPTSTEVVLASPFIKR
jgi:hypothetical protein